MSWASAYVGLPYAGRGSEAEGHDCWGLVRLVYRSELGIELPSYQGRAADGVELAEIDRLIARASDSDWWERRASVSPFNVLTFRRGRLSSHVGVAVTARQMLHMDETGSKIVDLTHPGWRHRFQGAWAFRRACA
ncbi:NlpC/P60 family protein [Puniceibacterium confluentis]|uniref:NlpC/P60 family protein n=1 Tax=Puniceibacterium confluentis TaxID=1958944 RepID=UPI0035622E8B